VGEGGIHLDVVEAEAVERGQLVLVLGHQPGAERRADGGDGRRPGMSLEQCPVLRGDRGDPLPPGLPGGIGAAHPLIGSVEHQVQQFCLARHVGVEGHRHHPEIAGDPAHGHRVQSLGIGQGGSRGDDLVDGQALARTVPGYRGRVAPQQLQGAGRVAGSGARGWNPEHLQFVIHCTLYRV